MVARLTLNQLVQVRVLYPLFFSLPGSMNLRSDTSERRVLFDLCPSDSKPLRDTFMLDRSVRMESIG